MHVVVAHARAAHVRHIRSFVMRILGLLRVDAEAFSVALRHSTCFSRTRCKQTEAPSDRACV